LPSSSSEIVSTSSCTSLLLDPINKEERGSIATFQEALVL
jgi:hypothetical protein